MIEEQDKSISQDYAQLRSDYAQQNQSFIQNNLAGRASNSGLNKTPQKFVKPLTFTQNQLNQLSTTQQSLKTIENKRKLSQLNNQVNSHNTTTTVTRPTGPSSNLNDSVLVSDYKLSQLQYNPQGHGNKSFSYNTPSGFNQYQYQKPLEKFVNVNSRTVLNYLQNGSLSGSNGNQQATSNYDPLAYDQVRLPNIKSKLKKMRRSKKRKIARTPVQREFMMQQVTPGAQAKQNQASNYDYEREQNHRIAKLLNIDQGARKDNQPARNESIINSDDSNQSPQLNSQLSQIQNNGNVSAFSPGKISRQNPSMNNMDRDKYLQSIIDQGVKLPIISQDSALQKQLNNFSQGNLSKNYDIAAQMKYRSGSSMSQNHNARNDFFRSQKRQSTQEEMAKSNFRTNRTQVMETTMSNSNRMGDGGVQTQENDNLERDTSDYFTFDSKKAYGNMIGERSKNSGYQIYQQNLAKTAKNVIDEANRYLIQNQGFTDAMLYKPEQVMAAPAYSVGFAKDNYFTSAQVYNQKAPNYMRPTQKFMHHIREISSGRESQKNLAQVDQSVNQKKESVSLEPRTNSNQQVYHQPNFPSKLMIQVMDSRAAYNHNSQTPNLSQGPRKIESSQNRNYAHVKQRHQSSQQHHQYQTSLAYSKQGASINVDDQQYTQRSVQSQGQSQRVRIGAVGSGMYGQKVFQMNPDVLQQVENDPGLQVKKRVAHHEKIQSIVQNLVSPRRRNRFCPCCQHKIERERNSQSPYEEEGKPRHNRNERSKESINDAKSTMSHAIQCRRPRNLDHNQSENNIIEKKLVASSVNASSFSNIQAGGFRFLRKGQNKQAYQRVPEGVCMNQFANEIVSDVQSCNSHRNQLYPKFKGQKGKTPWRYIGNKGYMMPDPQESLCRHCQVNGSKLSKGVGASRVTLRQSKQDSPQFGSARKISPEVEGRLLGRGHTCKKICSTLHNHVNTPMQKRQSILQPIIKPRPVSAEKILTHDISLSPMQFSIRDQDNQVSEGVFSPDVQDLEIQTQNHLLDNFKWKEEKSIEIETDPIIEEKKPEPVVEIFTSPIEISLPQTPTPVPSPPVEKAKPKFNYDWAESEIFKFVQDKHNYDNWANKKEAKKNKIQQSRFKNDNQNNLTKQELDIGKDLPSLRKESIIQNQLPIQNPLTNQTNGLRISQSEYQRSPDIVIDEYTDVLGHDNPINENKFNTVQNSKNQSQVDIIGQSSKMNTLSNQNLDSNALVNDSELQTEIYRGSTKNQLDRLDISSKETDRLSQMTSIRQIQPNIYDNVTDMRVRARQDQDRNTDPIMIQNQLSRFKDEQINQNTNQPIDEIAVYDYSHDEFNQNILGQNQSHVKQEPSYQYQNPNEAIDYSQQDLQSRLNQNSSAEMFMEPPEDDLNPHKFEIYTDVEATYKSSLLKKKARTQNNRDILLETHSIAKKTIEVLTCNMIQSDISIERIFEFYEEQTRENVIKLLLRCRLLYQARVDIKKILLLIIKKEEMYQDMQQLMTLGESNILKMLNKQELAKLFSEGLRTIQRLISAINNFRHEHKIFKGQFIFKGVDYQEALVEQRNIIQDFIWNYGDGEGTLQESINLYQTEQHTARLKDLSSEVREIQPSNIEDHEQKPKPSYYTPTPADAKQSNLSIENQSQGTTVMAERARQILQEGQKIDDVTFRNPVAKLEAVVYAKGEAKVQAIKPNLQIQVDD